MTARRWLVRIELSALMGLLAGLGCSDSSGPGDTTIDLAIDSIASPTNNRNPTVSGTTDPGATVTVTSPRDSLSDLAASSGAFSFTVWLRADAANTITVLAVDSAGNEIGDTITVMHDGRVPLVGFAAPLPSDTTEGQSGFTIAAEFADQASGVEFASGPEPTTFRIENDSPIGGVFLPNGTFSTLYPADTDLAPFFDFAGTAGATLVVPDSLAFPPGSNQLRARISDNAGNLSPPEYLTFEVNADPDRLIAVDASGAAGSTGNPLVIALANWDSVAGVQFDFIYSPAIIASVDSVTAVERAESLGSTDFNEVAGGRVRILLFDVDGDLIEPGQGPILNVWLTVQGGAASGTYAVTLTAVRLSDPAGQASEGLDTAGTFTVP